MLSDQTVPRSAFDSLLKTKIKDREKDIKRDSFCLFLSHDTKEGIIEEEI